MQKKNSLQIEQSPKPPKTPALLVLDNLRSGLNVGAAFRIADSLGLSQIILCGICPQPPHREILKTALGASETVPWQYFDQTTLALQTLAQQGYQLIAIEQALGSTPLQNWQAPQTTTKLAFVFGNEVQGLDPQALSLCHQCLEIPQLGDKHSLNVSVSMGIIAWEYLKQTLHNQS